MGHRSDRAAMGTAARIDGAAHDGPAALRECVACLLIEDGRVLAEKRSSTKAVLPGVLAIPGGHVDAGERLEDAVRREVREELDVVPRDLWYVCTLLHRSEEFRRLHYFAATEWEGTVTNHEAASLLWLPLNAAERLDLEVDRIAIAEFRRVYGDAGGSGSGP